MEGPAESGSPGRARLFRLALGLVFVALAVEVVLLVFQNRDLKRRLAEVEEAARTPRQQVLARLAPGDRVGPLELRSLAGAAVRIDYDEPDRDTLVLIFSPDCPACLENFASWKRIVSESAGSGPRCWYVSVGDAPSTRELAAQQDLGDPVLLADPQSLEGWQITHIPTTLRIGPGGIVRTAWVGILPEPLVAELAAAG